MSVFMKQVLLICGFAALAIIAVIMISYAECPPPCCTRHVCSDDTVSGGEKWGNELMRWTYPLWDDDPCDDTEECNGRCYEIAYKRQDGELTPVKRICGGISFRENGTIIYHDPAQYFNPYAVATEHFPRVGDYYDYYIRCCALDECGDYTEDYIEFKGGRFCCLENEGCESRCYPYAHYRFTEEQIPKCD